MENNTQTIGVSSLAQTYLLQTAKWAHFLAIVGFVSCGLMLLSGLFSGTLVGAAGLSSSLGSALSAGVIMFFYFLLAALYFLPCLYMFKMAKKIRAAVYNQSSVELEWAFQQQKNLFKYIGVFTLAILLFYVGIFVFVLVGGGIGMMMR